MHRIDIVSFYIIIDKFVKFYQEKIWKKLFSHILHFVYESCNEFDILLNSANGNQNSDLFL